MAAFDGGMTVARRLLETEVETDPILQLEKWMHDAIAAGGEHPEAMTLATVSAKGRPSARVVLLKSFDPRGFVFFSNYASRKGKELEQNPYAALVFWWGRLERQVRVEGIVEKVSADESDAYFATRPRGSQLGALASAQSSTISGRDELEARLTQLEAEFEGKDVSRPAGWGGYRLVHDVVEFWQGRSSRLHDRLRFTRSAPQLWRIERLSP